MKDRNVQFPHRYQLIPVAGEEGVFDIIAKPGTVTEAGTPLNKATLLSDATAALYGLTGEDTTVDGAFLSTHNKIEKLVINDLLTSLQLTANSINIDAWCDLLTDDSMMNTATSKGYQIAAGNLTNYSITTPTGGSIGSTASSFGFPNNPEIGTMIKQDTGAPLSLGSVIVQLSTEQSPQDGMRLIIKELVDGLPTGNILAESSNIVSGLSLTTEFQDFEFVFNKPTLQSGVGYALIFQRTGTPTSSDYYETNMIGTPGTIYSLNNSGVWSRSAGSYQYYTQVNFVGDIKWDPVESSEVLNRIAIVANGSNLDAIDWYISDDGINWIDINNLQQMYDTEFDNVQVYLRCVINNAATINAIAWGGI